jgi:DNA helicase II / ATP-dependent DNA helicase PcrA
MEYHDEQFHLEKILKELKSSYRKVNERIKGYDQEYQELKQYMVDYKNEMDKMELFGNQQALFTIDRLGVTKLKQESKLEKLIDSPYFGRFDFVYEGDLADEAESFYIGRFGFTDEEGEQLIYDWRAPVANIYYEFELGDAFYFTVDKQINGELIRKRQFNIAQSKFQYILESSLTIRDEVLQRTLSEHAQEKMKTIITSIQKEQNQIIRNETANIFIIQGVAGSGKTSVALHRIAYLLYKHRDTLRSDRVLILSPNKVFGNYISTVLPELGEEPIRETTIDQLTEKLLPGKFKFGSFSEQITGMMDNPESAFAKRAAIKSSLSFFEQLASFLQQLNDSIFANEPIVISDYKVEAHYMANRFTQYHKEPILKRLELLADDIIEVIKSKRQGEVKVPGRKEIIKRLQKRLSYKGPLEIYKAFLASIDRAEDFIFSENTFEFADVYPFLYCQHYFEGMEKFEMVEHLVIDEMQDYSPVQYAVIQKLFPCKKTILGDFGQSLNPFAIGTVNEFKNIFPYIDYVQLKKSYRSSYEIIEYAKKFIGKQAIEAIERHGKPPVERCYDSTEELKELLLTEIQQFEASGFTTCAIICKTKEQVETVAEMLGNRTFHIINEQTDRFSEGLSVTTIQFAKGLEFDQVLVPFVDQETYHRDFDKGLLYIACTRAMHQLTVLISKKEPSRFI